MAARAYLNNLTLLMWDVPFSGIKNAAVAASVMLAELAHPGLAGRYANLRDAPSVALMRGAVDAALRDPEATIERVKSGRAIEVTDDLLRGIEQKTRTTTPDGACAVDPLNPDGIDPDEITRRAIVA